MSALVCNLHGLEKVRHGLRWRCLECHRESLRRHRAKYRAEGISNLWDRQNRNKRRANKQVEIAIEGGRLTRQPCERCGTTENIHAHHEDYSKPLEVMWLCPKHHKERHREMRAEAA